MKIAFLYPEVGIYTENRNWLWWVADEMRKQGVEIVENDCTADCQAIVCMTMAKTKLLHQLHVKFSQIPIIKYNWDWFSFIDKSEGWWPLFTEYMKKSKDIWTPSKYMQKKMKTELGLEHYVIEACSVLEDDNFGGGIADEGYIVQASRRDARYKRFELFEKGCQELGLRYISCHPNKYTREQYIEILKGCKLLVVATCEDANAALSSIEAAYYKKPLLLSDIEPHIECWGENATYFKTDDFEDFKDKLDGIVKEKIKTNVDSAYELAMNRYVPTAMATAMVNRLKEIL